MGFNSADKSPWLADLEHDRASRVEMIGRMLADTAPYNAEEDSRIQRLLAMLSHGADGAEKAQQRNQIVRGATVDSSWTTFDEESGLMVGNTQLVIRGAGPLDIISYLMDLGGRHRQAVLNRDVELFLDVKEVRSAHCTIVFSEFKTAPFRNRTFLQHVMWKKLSDSQYVWCLSPVADHPSVSPSDESHAIRAEANRVLRFTCIAPNVTRVEYGCSVDLKGGVPTWVTNKIVIPQARALPTLKH